MEKFVLHQKTYDFILWLYPIINRLPKNHCLIIGKTLEELAVSLLLVLMKANKSRGTDRERFQEEASNTLDYLYIMIRLTKDIRLMSVKQYTASAEKLNEIGRMLTGWIGTAKSV
ncbi:MAG: diversity-generating retroelement protein Avd [Candidatus Shapirobacteria bacterium]|nr:diversity-generating retroelement protein Avd [Candidatus Shapirobacteria bacterium]